MKPASKCDQHWNLGHFKVGAHEWQCSHCGRISVWRESWSYYGMLACRKCHAEPAIEYVACSDACAQALVKAGKGGERRGN